MYNNQKPFRIIKFIVFSERKNGDLNLVIKDFSNFNF